MASRLSPALAVALALVTGAASVSAQGSSDAADRLRQVLPADVAAHVLARVSAARADGLPAEALVQRALKFAAKGVPPEDIDRAVGEQAERLASARGALAAAGRATTPDDVEAAAEAMRQGIDGATVSALARGAPSGRSLAVPLYVLGALGARGVPAADALARVKQMLDARASDAELESLPARAGDAARSPGAVGRDVSAARRGGATNAPGGRPPAGVPTNAGGGEHGHSGRPGRP